MKSECMFYDFQNVLPYQKMTITVNYSEDDFNHV